MSEEARRDTTVDEVEEVGEAPHDRGEWIKFGILASVLLGAVLVVALTRPLIFGRIVPAVMGEGQVVTQPQPPVGEPADVETTGEEAYPVSEEEQERTEAYPASGHESFIPAVGGPEDSYPAPEDEENGEETAVIHHIVQPNDNLTKIAEHYGVTIQEIIALNNIPNPNRIEAGTVLRIPVDGGQ
jgi:nucleoid-associated protein YgaU